MDTRHRKGRWYLPGRLYDMAFSGMFRGLRRRVEQTVETEGLYPWLDVCCGTGDQFRQIVGRSGKPGCGRGRQGEHEQRANGAGGEAVFGLDINSGMVRYAAVRAPGVPFVCGDAARSPFKDDSVRAITVSFGLHDKSPAVRSAMIEEARRVLAPDGRFIAVDFEKPWNLRSRLGAILAALVERFATGDHYRNGREFLRSGGLRTFLGEHGFVEVTRNDIATGSVSVVVARPDADIPCELSSTEI